MSSKKKKTGGDWTEDPPPARRKFNPEQVRDIRKAAANGWSVYALANKFEVARGTIRSIIKGESYTDVK